MQNKDWILCDIQTLLFTLQYTFCTELQNMISRRHFDIMYVPSPNLIKIHITFL